MRKDTKLAFILFIFPTLVLVGGIFAVNTYKDKFGLENIFNKPAVIQVGDNYYVTEVAGEKIEIGKPAQTEQTGTQQITTPVPDEEPVKNQNSAFPYAKLNRFDEEVALEVSYTKSDENYEIESDGEKVAWKGSSHEVHFYSIKPDTAEKKASWLKLFQAQAADGKNNVEKFEIELILKEKPETNIFNFDISTEGLNFYYQPELTKEEKDKGAFRPEDIIGSYAVYYKEQEGMVKSTKEAEKYKTGKAFHIYRPLIKDANGKEIWGKLNVDTENGVLSVSVSQEYLDAAAYPVSVDPTFGYDEAGASSWSEDVDSIVGSVFATHAEGAEGTSISAYMSAPSTGEAVKMAAYKYSDSSLVSDSQTNEFTVTTAQWYTQNFSSPPQLDAATQYALVTWSGSNPGLDASLYYDSVTLDQGVTAEADYSNLGGVFPSSVSFNAQLSHKFSIYVTYSEADPAWALNEETCNELDGWAWYTTNGRGACWSKTLAQNVTWNRGVGADSRTPGAYTCATNITALKDRMIAAATGEWYKVVSDVNGVTIDSSKNGSAGYSSISALAISDCVDGVKDLCPSGSVNQCLGASDADINTSLRNWAVTPGKSALPYCAYSDCGSAVDSDFRNACEQGSGYDLPLNCSISDIFYLNQKVCDDGDQNYTWAASADGTNSARILGYYNCSFVFSEGVSFINGFGTNYNVGFRTIVRPETSTPTTQGTNLSGISMTGVCVGDEACPLPPPWKLKETTCNALDGWAWYTTNGRGACWSKTLADSVSWNKGVGNDTDNPGTYTCATDVTPLKDRMIAAAAGEWYKIVSNVNGVTINSSKNGSSGYSSISALAISDCIDGTRDLCTGDGCLGADLTAVNTSLASWAVASGKSALPYCSDPSCNASTNNDWRSACEQNSGYDLPLSCSISNIFYKNQKVCNDGDANYTWTAAASSTASARRLGYSVCSSVSGTSPSSTNSSHGFRAVVRP